jgi:hypothetical protein
MKLEVGMYVRGKYYQYRGKIGKIIKNYNNDLEIAYKDGVLKTNVGSFIDDNYDVNGRQYAASFDIIDLVEVKDIIEIDVTDEDNYSHVLGINFIRIENERDLSNIKDMILNESAKLIQIVTHEQFEQMAYKVVE